MTLFDILVLDAIGAVWLAWLGFSWFIRRNEHTLTMESARDEVTQRMFKAWVDEDRDPLLSLQDLTPLVGVVVERRVDLLGEWFPEQHDPEPALLFAQLEASWTSPVNVAWQPAWATPTGNWETVEPRQLQVSSS